MSADRLSVPPSVPRTGGPGEFDDDVDDSSSRQAREGHHDAHLALTLLLGVPLAAVVLLTWQFVMQTSGAYNPNERVTGWSAALRDLPATVLLFVPIVVGLMYGVRAARLGSRRGVVAIWLQAGALFLVTWLVLSDTAEVLGTGSGAGLGWVWSLLAAAVLAAAVLVGCRRAARPEAPGARRWSPAGRSARLGLAVVLGGVALAFVWLFLAQMALSRHADGFDRIALPGQMTVTIDHPGTSLVYTEGNAPDALTDLTLRVVGPGGGVVPVRVVGPTAAYLRHLRGGRAVASFTADRPGQYRVTAGSLLPRVTAPYAPPNPNGELAVGESVLGWMHPHELGAAALVAMAVLVGAGLAVAEVRRRGGE